MNKFKKFLSIVPQVIQVVNVVEQVSDGKVKIGAQKAQMALDLLQTGLITTQTITDQEWQDLLPQTLLTINSYVKFANAVGLMKTTK